MNCHGLFVCTMTCIHTNNSICHILVFIITRRKNSFLHIHIYIHKNVNMSRSVCMYTRHMLFNMPYIHTKRTNSFIHISTHSNNTNNKFIHKNAHILQVAQKLLLHGDTKNQKLKNFLMFTPEEKNGNLGHCRFNIFVF